MAGSLEGQVALVTGAGRGIGRVAALALAREGAAVALVARSASELASVRAEAEELGARALDVVTDITDARGVEAAVDTTETALGPLTLLFNNAGTVSTVGPLWEADPEAWWRDQEVHVRGAFLCTRAVVARMVPRGQGRVVMTVSHSGVRDDAYLSAYACAKAAQIRLLGVLATEAGASGIRSFGVGPGLVRTALLTEGPVADDFARWLPRYANPDPSRYTPAEATADLVVRIARGDCDSLTGRFLRVSDDLETLLADAAEIRDADRLTMRLRE